MADDKNKPAEKKPDEKQKQDKGSQVDWNKEGVIDTKDADRFNVS